MHLKFIRREDVDRTEKPQDRISGRDSLNIAVNLRIS